MDPEIQPEELQAAVAYQQQQQQAAYQAAMQQQALQEAALQQQQAQEAAMQAQAAQQQAAMQAQADRDALTALSRQMQELMAAQTSLEGERRSMRSEIHNLREQLSAAARATAVAPAAPAASPKLPPGLAKGLSPQPFHGRDDVDELDGWIFSVNNYYSLYEFPDDTSRIRYTGLMLKGPALTWYRKFCETSPANATWASFLASLRSNFQAVNPERRARERLDQLEQRGTSLQEHVRQYRTLLMDIPTMGPADQLHNFICSLRPSLRKELVMKGPTDLDTAIIQAELIEAALKEVRTFDRGNHSRHQGRSSYHGGRSGGSTPMELGYAGRQADDRGSRPPKSFNYAGSQQQRRSATPFQRNIQLSTPERERLIREGRCLLCKQPGHMARHCPTRDKPGNGSRDRSSAPSNRSPSPTGSRR